MDILWNRCVFVIVFSVFHLANGNYRNMNRQQWGRPGGMGQRWQGGNGGFVQRPGHGPFVQQSQTSCSRPEFNDHASFEVEGCQGNYRNQACNWDRVPSQWKGTMLCEKNYISLKYTSTCSQYGDWDPPFPESCLNLIELQGFYKAVPNESTSPAPIFPIKRDCHEFQVRLTGNFVLSCLIPGLESEVENCFTHRKSVPSGTKLFLKCKPPYRSADGTSPEWLCDDGNWPNEGSKLMCIFSAVNGRPYDGGHSGNRNPSRPINPTFPWNPHTNTEIVIPTTPPPNRWTTIRPTRYTTVAPTPTVRLPTPAPVTSTTPLPPVLKEKKCPALTINGPGIRLECVFGGKEVSNTQCDSPMPIGSEAKYFCEDYHEATFGLKTLYRKCKEDGTWTGSSENFKCVPQCGRANVVRVPYITNGFPTVRGQWPWHSAIFLYNENAGQWSFICGGTLITKKAILTAAHCVTLFQTTEVREKGKLRVDLGKYEREQNDDLVQAKRISKIEVSPSYNPYGYDSDIAIIILESEVEIGYHVRPICFPQTSDSALEDLQLSENSIGTVVGWGYDENRQLATALRMAKLKVIARQECSQTVSGASSPIQTRSTTYCAGYHNGTNVCNGDSGGGMYFNSSDGEVIRWYLQGIVSVGIADEDGKCDPKQYSVFTRVGRYSDFVMRTLTENEAI